MTGETIRLTVPAALEYVRIVRLTASGVASRLGFDVEEIEDLRVAVDELSSLVVESADGGDLSVQFAVQDNALRIEGDAALAAGGPSAPTTSPPRSGAVVDGWDRARPRIGAVLPVRRVPPARMSLTPQERAREKFVGTDHRPQAAQRAHRGTPLVGIVPARRFAEANLR